MPESFRFGEFELDLAGYALQRAGRVVKLERIPMEVLILLVRQAGALVQRPAIQAALWAPDVFVEHDSAINTAVRKVRQALEDDAEDPRFVETVVGKGYRFIAPVHPDGAHADTPPVSCCVVRGKKEFVLRGGDHVLGRDPSVDVYVEHTAVSRRHARLVIRSQRATLEDLKSRNGTFINGRRIEAPTEIGHGAIIGLGPITLTFLVLSKPISTQSMSGGARG
jgi:DNA-binding winged helix-turn-helix (wHTH) protein